MAYITLDLPDSIDKDVGLNVQGCHLSGLINDPAANQFATRKLGKRKAKREENPESQERENPRSMPIDGQFDMWSQVYGRRLPIGWDEYTTTWAGRGLVELPFRNSFTVSSSVLSAHTFAFNFVYSFEWPQK